MTMVVNDGKNVVTCEGIVLWDGITQPGTDDKTGATIHSLKIAIPTSAPERAELEALAQRALQADPAFRGQLPPGGEWPLRAIDTSKMGDSAPLMVSREAINANTRLGAPQVFDANGNVLSSMQYARMLYAGAVVKLLVHAYSFNNKSKGVAFGLDGVQIIDATAPRLGIGGGMSPSQVAAAFGGAPTAMPQAAPAPTMPPPTAAAPVQPHPGFVTGAAMAPPPAPVHQMTPLANGATYEQMIAAGWTDALLVQHGMMLS
jgi:hypothetical protein